MSYLNKEELEKIRPSVTGIGWATPQQAALYLGVTHVALCVLLISGEIPYSMVNSKGKRIRYLDLDDYMVSQRVHVIDLDALADEAVRCLG